MINSGIYINHKTTLLCGKECELVKLAKYVDNYQNQYKNNSVSP